MNIYHVNEILKSHALNTKVISDTIIIVLNAYANADGAVKLTYNEGTALWEVDNGTEVNKMTLSEYLGY